MNALNISLLVLLSPWLLMIVACIYQLASSMYRERQQVKEYQHTQSVKFNRSMLIECCTIKQRALLRFMFKTGSLTCSQFQTHPVLLSFGVLASLIKAGYIINNGGVYALADVYQY